MSWGRRPQLSEFRHIWPIPRGTAVAQRLTFIVLKITTTDSPEGTTLKIEGRIAGDWVDELSRAVAAVHRPERRVRVDLAGVTFVDAIGAVYLRTAAASGVDLTNSSDFVSQLIRGGQA